MNRRECIDRIYEFSWDRGLDGERLVFVFEMVIDAAAIFNPDKKDTHVPARDLSMLFFQAVVERCGHMACFVLWHFGIKRSFDLGAAVAQLIEWEVLFWGEGDQLEDFSDVCVYGEHLRDFLFDQLLEQDNPLLRDS